MKNRTAVRITCLKLLAEAGMSSHAISCACNWSLQEIRSQWAEHCHTTVWNLLAYEHELGRLPTKQEVAYRANR